VFRAWWKSELVRVSRMSGVLIDNTDQVVLMFHKVGVDAAWFHSMCAGIAGYKAAQQIQQRRNAAKARWSQKKRPQRPKKRR